MFKLSICCEELPVLFGCGGMNLPDGLFEPLHATDNSALYGVAFPSCCVACAGGTDSMWTSFLLHLGVNICAPSWALLLGVWKASPSNVMGLILLKPYPMSFNSSDLILEKELWKLLCDIFYLFLFLMFLHDDHHFILHSFYFGGC